MTETTTIDAGEIAFDPAVHPERYGGVRTRRIFGFLVDALIILALMLLAYVLIVILGVLTLGIAWLLLPAVWPVVAILYAVLTLGGPQSATLGMRITGVDIRTLRGEPMNHGLAFLHALLFWLSMSLTPLVLVVALFTPRKQLLHDLLIGTMAVRRY